MTPKPKLGRPPIAAGTRKKVLSVWLSPSDAAQIKIEASKRNLSAGALLMAGVKALGQIEAMDDYCAFANANRGSKPND